MRFDTRQFEWAHGKKARGRGCWAFEFFKSCGEQLGETFFTSFQTFTDAKKEARAEGRRRGATDARLGS